MYIHLHSLRNFSKIAGNATEITAQSEPADVSADGEDALNAEKA
jgi:hypothetical protein